MYFVLLTSCLLFSFSSKLIMKGNVNEQVLPFYQVTLMAFVSAQR